MDRVRAFLFKGSVEDGRLPYDDLKVHYIFMYVTVTPSTSIVSINICTSLVFMMLIKVHKSSDHLLYLFYSLHK
jgi:hypothetical protein